MTGFREMHRGWEMSPHVLEAAKQAARELGDDEQAVVEDERFVVSKNPEGAMHTLEVDGETFYIAMNIEK